MNHEAGVKTKEFVSDTVPVGNIGRSLSYYGLHLPPMFWREIDNFSSGSVCLALASEGYDEKDYYREYKEYLRAVGAA